MQTPIEKDRLSLAEPHFEVYGFRFDWTRQVDRGVHDSLTFDVDVDVDVFVDVDFEVAMRN